MKKKSLSIVVITALCASLLAACGGTKDKGGDASAGGSSSSPASTASAAPVKKTFTALLDNNATFPYSKDWPVWNMIEEKTGVRLDVQVPSGKLADTLNLTIASNNLPDLMYMSNRNDSNKYGMQGALANILDYVDQMPNIGA